MSLFVVFMALLAIGHADLASVPVTLNSIAPVAVVSSASLVDASPANEFTEWAEYKVKSSKFIYMFCVFMPFCPIA